MVDPRGDEVWWDIAELWEVSGEHFAELVHVQHLAGGLCSVAVAESAFLLLLETVADHRHHVRHYYLVQRAARKKCISVITFEISPLALFLLDDVLCFGGVVGWIWRSDAA
jgi:hypothetical protein